MVGRGRGCGRVGGRAVVGLGGGSPKPKGMHIPHTCTMYLHLY